MLEGLIEQKETDAERGEGECKLCAVEIGAHVDEDAVELDNPPAELEGCCDTILGIMLDPAKIEAARHEEVDFVHEFDVYRKIHRASAVGGQFVTVKRIDVNKGCEQRPGVQEPPGGAQTPV